MASEVYSVSGDTATGVVYFIALRQEIIDDPVAPASESILINGDVLTINFAVALNPTEKAALDAVVAAHPTTAETRNPDAGTQSYAYPRDPGVDDDFETIGAQRGDTWLNTLTGTAYVCQSNANGAALWSVQGGGGGDTTTPGQYLLGGILDYPTSARMTASEIQYSRVFLPAGVELANGMTFIDALGNPTRYLRMGLYSQTDPTQVDGGIPVTRVAQSNEVATGPGLDGTYLDLPFTDAPTGGSGSPITYTVPDTGYYWIAIVSDNNVVKLGTSLVYRENYLPVYRESTTDATLPATVGTITNPSSALALAIVEI